MAKKLEPVCPHCGEPLDPKFIHRLAGHLGGSVTGATKARTTEQARAAALKRWAKKRRSSATVEPR